MRRSVLVAALLLGLVAPAVAQLQIDNPGGIVIKNPGGPAAARPVCAAENDGIRYETTDAANAGDCSTNNGGTSRAVCTCRGGEWIPAASEFRLEDLSTECADGKLALTSTGSIVCADPPQGSAGPAGPQGPQGEPGVVDACAAWPVGSVFISTSATSPTLSLGCGVWTSFAAGRVLVGVDPLQPEFGTAEETGGSKSHTLTTVELPAHSHGVTDPGHAHLLQRYPTTSGPLSGFTADTSMNGTPADATLDTKSGTTGVTVDSAGSGEAFSTLPPYIVVYIFRRTA